MGLSQRVTKSYNLWRGGDKNLFFLYRNLSLLLVWFINFKAIESPERILSNKQPRYVNVWYCLMCISPYLISRLLALLSLCFAPNSIYTLFCPLRNAYSVYYLETNHKHLKSSYLDFSLFLSRLCADNLNRCHLLIEISQNLQLASYL